MISCMIDAMEGRDVATYDIQGTFLKNDYDKGEVNINMEGEMMNLHVKINPAYLTSLYSTLQASLIFCTKLSKSLEEIGYKRNEYDWCVMNKIVKGKKCNILWHIDYLKVFHVDCDIVSTLISDIDTEYGKFAKITITQGKI